MFDRIKKAFLRQAAEGPEPEAPASQLAGGAISEWAATQGLGFSVQGAGGAMALEGRVGGKRWRMEIGRSTRSFIHGEELRARAQLDIREDLAVLAMNRPLKEALDKQAYAIYTDSLRTMADPSLPEELRWLSMYDEVGWDNLPAPFWQRYSVLAERREDAMAWIEPALADLMLAWPQPGLAAQVPFVLMLLRGKVYLRMEYNQADVATLQHAAAIFTGACEAALGGLSLDLSL
jgi:hypothetical protein